MPFGWYNGLCCPRSFLGQIINVQINPICISLYYYLSPSHGLQILTIEAIDPRITVTAVTLVLGSRVFSSIPNKVSSAVNQRNLFSKVTKSLMHAWLPNAALLSH